MKNLGNLSPAKGSNKDKKRLGRGPASGQGKTAGKGHKGQKARKGGGVAPGFEGGQTPLYRRLPKYGFKNTRNMKQYHIVNLTDLETFESDAVIDAEALVKAGLVRNLKHPVKVLGEGKIEKKLTVKAAKFSKSAKAAIEGIGGSTQEI